MNQYSVEPNYVVSSLHNNDTPPPPYLAPLPRYITAAQNKEYFLYKQEALLGRKDDSLFKQGIQTKNNSVPCNLVPAALRD